MKETCLITVIKCMSVSIRSLLRGATTTELSDFHYATTSFANYLNSFGPLTASQKHATEAEVLAPAV